MYINIYTYVYTYIYMCIYTYTYVYTYVCAYIYMCIYTLCTFYIYIHIFIYTYTYIYLCVYVCVCARAYVYDVYMCVCCAKVFWDISIHALATDPQSLTQTWAPVELTLYFLSASTITLSWYSDMHLQSNYFGNQYLERCGFNTSWGNSLSIGGWIMWLSVIQHKEKDLTKYWDLTET